MQPFLYLLYENSFAFLYISFFLSILVLIEVISSWVCETRIKNEDIVHYILARIHSFIHSFSPSFIFNSSAHSVVHLLTHFLPFFVGLLLLFASSLIYLSMLCSVTSFPNETRCVVCFWGMKTAFNFFTYIMFGLLRPRYLIYFKLGGLEKLIYLVRTGAVGIIDNGCHWLFDLLTKLLSIQTFTWWKIVKFSIRHHFSLKIVCGNRFVNCGYF